MELSAPPPILISLLPHQVMVFPGLGLSHEAFLTTAEFGTQELGQPAQMRLQVYRPMGGAGGTLSWWWELGDLGSLCAVTSAGPLATGLVSSLKVDIVGSTETLTHARDPKDRLGRACLDGGFSRVSQLAQCWEG